MEFDRDIVDKQAGEELERALDLVQYIVIHLYVMRLYCTILIYVPTGHLSLFADTIHWCLSWSPTMDDHLTKQSSNNSLVRHIVRL